MQALIFLVISLIILINGLFIVEIKKKVKNNPLPQIIEINPGNSADSWKTWQDGDSSEIDDKYRGYKINYPRDFDVYRGDQAKSGFIGNPRITVQFPEDAFETPKTNYSEASLTVSIGTDKKSLRDCYAFSAENSRLEEKTSVNGIEFIKATAARGAAAGNFYTSEIYRTLRDDRCYEITLTVHTKNPEVYQPLILDEFDKEKAFAVLRKTLRTFKFTSSY